MDFVTAVKTCLSKFVDFSGRASRSEFWWFFLFQVLVSIVASFLGDVVTMVVGLALLLPALAVGVRRLHDIGKSGWFLLLCLIPVVNLVLIYFFVQPSQTQDNNFGVVPVA